MDTREIIKSPKLTFLITIISSILLFTTQTFMEKIALYQFKEKYTVWIGIVFISTLGLSIIHIYEFLKRLYDVKILERKERKAIEESKLNFLSMLELLDHDELINIREFYLQKKNNIEMIVNDAAVTGLTKKGIIKCISKQGWTNKFMGGHVFIFELSRMAKTYFDTYDFTKLESIPRPNWCNDIENSHKMKQNIENLQTSLFNDLK